MNSSLVPILFTPEVIRKSVIPNRTGVYLLGNDVDGFEVRYVGRSDNCVKTRLLSHNHIYKYDYFVLLYAGSEVEAFWMECQYWHVFHKSHISNKIHPASPPKKQLECPYCHFTSNVVKLLG